MKSTPVGVGLQVADLRVRVVGVLMPFQFCSEILRVYAKTMARSEAELDALRALVGGDVPAAERATDALSGQRAWI